MVFSHGREHWKADKEIRMKSLQGDAAGKSTTLLHAVSRSCRVVFNKQHVLLKAVLGTQTFLTLHSSLAPRLIIRQLRGRAPPKAGVCPSPCLHLVNGSELTPINTETARKPPETPSVCEDSHYLSSQAGEQRHGATAHSER